MLPLAAAGLLPSDPAAAAPAIAEAVALGLRGASWHLPALDRASRPQLRELRAVQALRWQDTPAARGLLAEWAKGDPAATLTRAASGK